MRAMLLQLRSQRLSFYIFIFASEEIAPGGGKMRDPGNEVDAFEVHFLMRTKHVSHETSSIFSCKIRNAIKYCDK